MSKRIYEGHRRLSTVDVEHVGVAIPWGGLDGVVVGEEAMQAELAPLVEADGDGVSGEYVQVHGLTRVAVPRCEE